MLPPHKHFMSIEIFFLCSQRLILGSGRINHGFDLGNAVGGKLALFGMRSDRSLVGCDVEAINLIIRYVALQPLNLWTHCVQDITGLL